MPHADVHINKAIETELTWFIGHVSQSSRVLLLKSVAWDLNMVTNNLTHCYTDTCLMGMAYYYPELALGYQYLILEEEPYFSTRW